jgi:hypothetical protein
MIKPNSQKAIDQINSVRQRALAAPRGRPTAGRCPTCNGLLHTVTSYRAVSPPAIVLDGLSSTLYACLRDRLFWIHEAGGIANVGSWLGPVPAEANELEGIVRPIRGSKTGSP